MFNLAVCTEVFFKTGVVPTGCVGYTVLGRALEGSCKGRGPW